MQLSEVTGFKQEEVESIVRAFVDGMKSHFQADFLLRDKFEPEMEVSDQVSTGVESTDFSAEELTTLKQAPFLVFMLVAAADGKVDKKEASEFAKVLVSQEIKENLLMNRIVTNVVHDLPGMLASVASSPNGYFEELGKITDIVDRKVSKEEARQFKIALLLLGKRIAEASGGFLGFGSKISKEEKVALAGIAMFLGLEMV